MNDINQTVQIGTITREFGLDDVNGNAKVDFGIAVNRSYKRGDEWQEEVSFFNVTAWRELAENVSSTCDKGTRVVVIGRLEQQRWEKDGEKKSKDVIVANVIAPSLEYATAEITKNPKKERNN